MSTRLGKRKRHATKDIGPSREQSEESLGEELDAQEIFRRHFEAQFKPLPKVQNATVVEESSDQVPETESDWGGLSDGEEDGVQVVEHEDAQARMAAMSKEELKIFMSSKIPKITPSTCTNQDRVGSKIVDDDDSEAANLKKDLALQRLLTESHLLESSSNPILSGNNRHKATDLRLQTLGSKTSILKQKKMPMSHRKGMITKAGKKEEKRRHEAKENGIILEKAKMATKKTSTGKRDRGIGAPGVGKFSGGTLTLSKKDIYEIEGPRTMPSARGDRSGRRGSGRGKGKRGR